MAIAKGAVICLTTFMVLFGASIAATYNVGDTDGWTTRGNIDYKKWAEGKEFHVGDTLVFNYNKAFHDVKQVSEQDFNSCNGQAPIAEYTSGSDSIILKTAGHHYFLCGIPGHCQVGQKVDINVLPGSLSPGASPSPAGSPATSPSSGGTSSSTTGSSTTAPPSDNASSLHSFNQWLAAAAGMVAVFLAGSAF